VSVSSDPPPSPRIEDVTRKVRKMEMVAKLKRRMAHFANRRDAGLGTSLTMPSVCSISLISSCMSVKDDANELVEPVAPAFANGFPDEPGELLAPTSGVISLNWTFPVPVRPVSPLVPAEFHMNPCCVLCCLVLSCRDVFL